MMTAKYIKLDSFEEGEVYARQVGDELQESDSVYVANAGEPGDMGISAGKVAGYREMPEDEKRQFAEIYSPSREWGMTPDTQTDRGLAGEMNTEKVLDGGE
jgi:hypothetical protein